MKNALALGALIAVFSLAFTSENPRADVKKHSQAPSRETVFENAAE